MFASKAPSKAHIVVSVIGPMLGGEALDLILGIIPTHFSVRDLGGGTPVADAAEARRIVSEAMDRLQPITPYSLMDLFRRFDLVGNEASGRALFDASLADEMNTSSAVHAGMVPQVGLAGFDAGSLSSDRLRFTAAAIAANAAAIHDRWSD